MLRAFHLVSALFLSGLLACAAAAGAGPKILHFGNGAEPQDLDPQAVTGSVERNLLNALYEGLVVSSPVNDDVVPGVAESWEIAPDHLTYTFHLRPTATWSNGDPVTAYDYVRSYQRILTPVFGAEFAYNLYHVVGAEDYNKGTLKDFSKTGFKALDAHTLQITLHEYTPFLLRSMTNQSWFAVHLPTVEKFGGLERKGTAWTRPENFVGNGPFRLVTWLPNQKIVVERSPTYWDHANVKLDQIHFYPVESVDTEERMFRSGQLDVTSTIPTAKIATYRKTNPAVLRIEPFCAFYFYRFNVTKKPLDDLRVRRALCLAIDREVIVRNVVRGGQTPAYSMVPPGTAGYQSDYRLTGDLAEAKRLLAEAGYPNGKNFPRIQILYNTSESHRSIAEAIQQMWKQNLGVEIGLYNQEWKVYLDADRESDFQIARAGWFGDGDPHDFLDIWSTGNPNNHTLWGNPTFDALLAESLKANSEAERYAIYQKMEKILIDELPILPIYFYTRVRLISEKVLNYHSNQTDQYPFKYVDMKE